MATLAPVAALHHGFVRGPARSAFGTVFAGLAFAVVGHGRATGAGGEARGDEQEGNDDGKELQRFHV